MEWHSQGRSRFSVSYLVIASMIKTLENSRFGLKLITEHPDQEKLQSKKVKLEAIGYKFRNVSLQWHGVPMIALICLPVPKMTALYYGTLILPSWDQLNFDVPALDPKLHGVLCEHPYFMGKLVFITLRLVLDTVLVRTQVDVHGFVTEHSIGSSSSEFEAAMHSGDRSLLRLLCDQKTQESESEDEKQHGDSLSYKMIPLRILVSRSLDRIVEAKEGLYGEDFFNNFRSPKSDTPASSFNNNFVAEESVPVLEEPIAEHDLQNGNDDFFDDAIQRALVVGDYKGAVAQCIAANKMADALVIAHVIAAMDLMEKTVVLALAMRQQRLSASLCKLIEKYAEILASTGLLSTAMEYLKLYFMCSSPGPVPPPPFVVPTRCPIWLPQDVTPTPPAPSPASPPTLLKLDNVSNVHDIRKPGKVPMAVRAMTGGDDIDTLNENSIDRCASLLDLKDPDGDDLSDIDDFDDFNMIMQQVQSEQQQEEEAEREFFLSSKKNGGLGVSSFYAINRGLLFKWVWRFITQDASLWYRLIKAIHGVRGVTNNHSSLKRASPWTDLVRDFISLNHKDFFALESRKDITVAEKLRQSCYDFSFRRSPREGLEKVQYNGLCSMISDISLPNMSDRWFWSLDGSGEFSVRSVCCLIDDVFLPKSDTPTTWVKLIPIKVNVLA
ncbi:RNA-directed DNA polymerase, eukaryota, reverse transcriptase zinc-binding domain protein [Tanacetum coccineum]|uniref:RNA-directed DNA polymerase, eukaryota, reverse transcriptase zinc-binding domain protein n=1 Tax=Tanacetum coccineum TaxID=301880 RepID=A0ABQ5ICJ9_9ASTR